MSEIVECRSGGAYAERPLALTWEGARREVVEVLAEWRSPGEKHFRVRTTGDLAFELTYDETAGAWHIEQI